MRFKRKGYGRIFTDSEVNVARIREMIREMDADEYTYLPDDLIAVDEGLNQFEYNGKFCDFDLDALKDRCDTEGIPCRVIVKDEYHICPQCGYLL